MDSRRISEAAMFENKPRKLSDKNREVKAHKRFHKAHL